MRILFCGDREWDDVIMVGKTLQKYDPVDDVIVHGAARGADTIAGVLAEWMGFIVEPYPADWNTFEKAAGPIRNKQMLDSGLDKVEAFHNDLSKSKGTADMVRIATKADIPVTIHASLEKQMYL
jgi:hypothetical protein